MSKKDFEIGVFTGLFLFGFILFIYGFLNGIFEYIPITNQKFFDFKLPPLLATTGLIMLFFGNTFDILCNWSYKLAKLFVEVNK